MFLGLRLGIDVLIMLKSIAEPQSMYYSDQGSGLWFDTANWFTDSGHTILAGRLPINDDSIWASSQFTDNAPAITISSFNGTGPATATQTALLYVTGGVYLNAGVWGGNNESGAVGYFSGTGVMGSGPADSTQWVGSCEFHDSSSNEGQISLYAYFYDTSYNGNLGSVFVPYFYDYSYNQGFFADAWFYNYSYNSSGYGGNSGQFYDYSINYGAFSMGANFYDSSTNDTSGSITADVTFNGFAINNGSVSGIASFNDFSRNNTYLGTGVFYASSEDYGSTYVGSYYGSSSTQTGNITGYAVFNDGSVNNGENLYDALFNGTSYNNNLCDTNATFYGYSYNQGTVVGDGTFYDISENAGGGTISTNGYFNNSSKNFGTVTGDGYFYDSSDQLGTVGGVTTCSTSGTCP